MELSYLREEEQYELYAVMDIEQCTLSLSQANRMKRMSQSGKLDMDAIYLVLEEEKPNQREQIRICSDRLNPYFPVMVMTEIDIMTEEEYKKYKKKAEENADTLKEYMRKGGNESLWLWKNLLFEIRYAKIRNAAVSIKNEVLEIIARVRERKEEEI